MNIAARPGHQLICRHIRLGLPIPRGWRCPGPSWYIQKRRARITRQFHALGARGVGLSSVTRAQLVYGLHAPHESAVLACAHCGRTCAPRDMWPDAAGRICQTCWVRVSAARWWGFLSGIAASDIQHARYA